jgi:hypothetical protein
MNSKLGWSVFVSVLVQPSAYAQQVDCDRIRATTVPYQIQTDQEIIPTPNPQNLKTVTLSIVNQVFRSESGGPKTTYSKQGDAPVRKITGYGPLPIELSIGGQRRIRWEYQRLDPSKTQAESNYEFEQTIIPEGREPETFSITRSVVEKKVVMLSNCSFNVIKYLVRTVTKANAPNDKLTLAFAEVEYMPELQEIYSSKTYNTKTMTQVTWAAREIRLDFVPFE